MPEPDAAPGPASLAARVRAVDPDRYATVLFAPAATRPALFALVAFNHEIARVREVVSEPVLGQIRLHWWREALEGIYAGAPPAHDVARALADALALGRLERAILERMIEARERDLAEEPPARIEELLSYAQDTAGGLIELMLQALDADVPAAREAGRAIGAAYALVGLARAIPFHARARRSYLPSALLAEHGLAAEDLYRQEPPQALPAAVAKIAGLARVHLLEARDLAGPVPRRAVPALLSAAVAETYLRRLDRAGYDVYHPSVAERPPGLIWRLAAKAWTGRW